MMYCVVYCLILKNTKRAGIVNTSFTDATMICIVHRVIIVQGFVKFRTTFNKVTNVIVQMTQRKPKTNNSIIATQSTE